MIDEADRDGDGLINPDEFYRVMRKRGDNPGEKNPNPTRPEWDADGSVSECLVPNT